jgi:hypothetical protein
MNKTNGNSVGDSEVSNVILARQTGPMVKKVGWGRDHTGLKSHAKGLGLPGNVEPLQLFKGRKETLEGYLGR